MRIPRLSANLKGWLLFGRGKQRWAAAFLFLALFPGSNQSIIQDNAAPRVKSISIASPEQIEMVGVWPYGKCEASAIDASRNIALIGNGETLQVLDISNPSSLSQIGEVRIKGNPQDIVLAGNYAYLVTKSYFVIVDLSDPQAPRETGSVFISAPRAIAYSPNHVFLATMVGLLIYDVSNPYQPVFKVQYRHDNIDYIDVALWNGYALCLGKYWSYSENQILNNALDVIDISNPAAPSLYGTLDLGRDYQLRAIDASPAGQAYVCQSTENNGAGRLVVIDVASDPSHPTEVGRYSETGRGFERIGLTGNYACLTKAWPGSLTIIDVSIPQSPIQIGECEIAWLGNVHVSGNLAAISTGGYGFSLYSFANPADPYELGNFDTPDTGGVRGNGVVARENYAFLAGGSDGLRIMDVSEPANPLEAGLFNETSVGMGLAVSGNYAYGLGDSFEGWRLHVIDIASPRSPSLVASCVLPCPEPVSDRYDFWGITVRASYAYILGTNWGSNPQRAFLLIVDVSEPFSPRLAGSLTCAYQARCIGRPALLDDYLYMGVEDYSQGANDPRAGLRVIDVSDAKNPREVFIGVLDIPSIGVNVAVRDHYAFLTGDMLRIFDLSNPRLPRLLVSYVLYCDGIAFSGNFIYLNADKLWAIDISNLYYPTGFYFRGESGTGIDVSGNLAFVSGSLSVLKNTSAPDVSLVAPSGSSTLLGSVTVEAQAAHDSGIERVEFFIDDILNASDTSAPYSFTWDTTLVEDGLHAIRARAHNTLGNSSDAEREVFTRLVYAPLNFSGTRVAHGSPAAYDALTWQAHPENVNIAKYLLFQVREGRRIPLIELDADIFQYQNPRIFENITNTYALVVVNDAGRESEPVTVTVRIP